MEPVVGLVIARVGIVVSGPDVVPDASPDMAPMFPAVSTAATL